MLDWCWCLGGAYCLANFQTSSAYSQGIEIPCCSSRTFRKSMFGNELNIALDQRGTATGFPISCLAKIGAEFEVLNWVGHCNSFQTGLEVQGGRYDVMGFHNAFSTALNVMGLQKFFFLNALMRYK